MNATAAPRGGRRLSEHSTRRTAAALETLRRARACVTPRPQGARAAICRDTRAAMAMIVSIGLTPSELGSRLPSAT